MGFSAVSPEPKDGFWLCLIFSILRRVLQKGIW